MVAECSCTPTHILRTSCTYFTGSIQRPSLTPGKLCPSSFSDPYIHNFSARWAGHTLNRWPPQLKAPLNRAGGDLCDVLPIRVKNTGFVDCQWLASVECHCMHIYIRASGVPLATAERHISPDGKESGLTFVACCRVLAPLAFCHFTYSCPHSALSVLISQMAPDEGSSDPSYHLI